MKHKKILRYCLFILFLMTISSQAFAETPNNEIKEIVVSNATEFVKAIGSNRKIILKPGTYDLSKIKQFDSADGTVSWKSIYDGKELNINNVQNLIIHGEKKDKVSIITDYRYASILNFNKSVNITINNIVAGHTPQEYECDAGVLYFNNCYDININNSLLYGCGSMGVSLNKVNKFNFNDSTITDCSLRAARIYNSKYVRFNRSTFNKNRAYMDIFSISNSNVITLDECVISNNNNWECNLIDSSDTPIVLLNNCTIKNNSKSSETTFSDPKATLFEAQNGKILINDSIIQNNNYDLLVNDRENVLFTNLFLTDFGQFFSVVGYNNTDIYLEGILELKDFEHPNGTKLQSYVLTVDGVSYTSLGDDPKSCVRKVQDNICIDVFSDPELYDLKKLVGDKQVRVKLSGKALIIGTAWYYSDGRINIEKLEIDE